MSGTPLQKFELIKSKSDSQVVNILREEKPTEKSVTPAFESQKTKGFKEQATKSASLTGEKLS